LAKEKVFDGKLLAGPVTIGIDQSLTGFALTAMNLDEPAHYITWVYKSPYKGVQRLDDIQTWMFDKFEELKKDHTFYDVAMEGTVLASHSALVLGELAATVKLFFFEYFWDTHHFAIAPDQKLRTPLQIPPMTLKKFAAGKGNAKKQEMLMQIFKRWGIEFNDDNAADSYALARLAGKIFEGPIETAVAEQIKDEKFRDIVFP
jgi:Holliday junction resolvasome RuvABC endonuclease subunit